MTEVQFDQNMFGICCVFHWNHAFKYLGIHMLILYYSMSLASPSSIFWSSPLRILNRRTLYMIWYLVREGVHTCTQVPFLLDMHYSRQKKLQIFLFLIQNNLYDWIIQIHERQELQENDWFWLWHLNLAFFKNIYRPQNFLLSTKNNWIMVREPV